MADRDRVAKGTYGIPIRLRAIDSTGAVRDISGSTTLEIDFRDPDGSITTKTAAYTTDGTDGNAEWQVTSGFLVKTGVWRAQLVFGDGTEMQPSAEIYEFEVVGALTAVS